MFDPKIFDDLSRKLVDGLPSGLQALQGDVERNVKASLEAALRQMNLVSRDEFEIQQAILMRTREKVEALETRVAELKYNLNPNKFSFRSLPRAPYSWIQTCCR